MHSIIGPTAGEHYYLLESLHSQSTMIDSRTHAEKAEPLCLQQSLKAGQSRTGDLCEQEPTCLHFVQRRSCS